MSCPHLDFPPSISGLGFSVVRGSSRCYGINDGHGGLNVGKTPWMLILTCLPCLVEYRFACGVVSLVGE